MPVAQRIVSLLPSATETVCAVGLEDRLVGVSHSCDYPPAIRSKPRLTRPRLPLDGLSSGEIDAAVRHALREFGSVVCEICAVPTRDAATAALGLASCPEVLAGIHRRRHGALQPARASRRGRRGAARCAAASRCLPERNARGESGCMALAELENPCAGRLARVNSRLGSARKRACPIEHRAGLPALPSRGLSRGHTKGRPAL